MLLRALILCLMLSAAPFAQVSSKRVQVYALPIVATDDGVMISLPWSGGKLWRGYRPVELIKDESTVLFRPREHRVWDREAPDNVTLHYLAKHPDGRIARGEVRTLNHPLPKLEYPRIQVDKLNYTLSVYDANKLAKRYPIALGGNPTNRKVCQDRRSTPEGLYQVHALQPHATFYRAYDIDYPSDNDRLRHQLSKQYGIIGQGRAIGGEIQIHGHGIAMNWTHGCMALRDFDMDELFSHPELAKGLEVFITGSQIKPEDRPWLLVPPHSYVKKLQAKLLSLGYELKRTDGEFDPSTAKALGQFQRDNGLWISCQLDRDTRELLGY